MTDRILTLVFTNLEDSTALKVAQGDAHAAEMIARHRTHLSHLAAEYGGHIIDFAGDGCFLTFETSSAAVLFALQLQQLHAQEPALPRVRIGVHLGEVAESTNANGTPRVEGLAVDLAARIQALARPGQVLLAAPVAASARPRFSAELWGRPIRWQNHGSYTLKGGPEPIELVEIGLEGAAPFVAPAANAKGRPTGRAPRRAMIFGGLAMALVIAGLAFLLVRWGQFTAHDIATPIRAIAVLPLENLSGDPTQDYFADAMTETLIAELAKLPEVRVISRTSVMQYKGARRPLPEIAHERACCAAWNVMVC